MTTDMRRTNSYLKGLAETRARSAGDVIRYEWLLGELGDLLADSTACRAAIPRDAGPGFHGMPGHRSAASRAG
jgi:hypothetical protein